MGQLLYGSNHDPIILDDRLLWHLKLVIIAKLRRQEPFSFSWQHAPAGEMGGQSCVWIHAGADLRFDFDSTAEVTPNRTWLEALMLAANATAGLSALPEPGISAAKDTRRSPQLVSR